MDKLPIYELNNKVIADLGITVEAVTEYRQHLHKICEGGLKCFNTRDYLKKVFISHGVKEGEITEIA